MSVHGSSRSVVGGGSPLCLLWVGALVVGCSSPSPAKSKTKPVAEEEARVDTPPKPGAPSVAVEAEPEAPPVANQNGSSEGSLPPVNPIEARKLAEALRNVEDSFASQAAALGLAELESRRLPEYLTTALSDYGTVAPEQRSMVVSREIGTEAGQKAWDEACAGGIVVFQEVAVAAPEAKAGILFERCDLGRFGLFDAKAAGGADPSALLLATMTAQHLQSHNSLSEDEGYAITKLTVPVADSVEDSGAGPEGEE